MSDYRDEVRKLEAERDQLPPDNPSIRAINDAITKIIDEARVYKDRPWRRKGVI